MNIKNYLGHRPMCALVRVSIFASFMVSVVIQAAEEEHSHEKPLEIELTQQQQLNGGIQTAVVALSKGVTSEVVPGEVINNDFQTELVSIAVPSQVKARFVSLGETVKKGQKLATLYSYEVARAQIRYRLADDEWSRVKKLKGAAVSEKDFLLSKAERQTAASQLRDYGFSEVDILYTANKPAKLLGLYHVYANIDGSVLAEQLQLGRRFLAGEVIAKISNEEKVWVQARIPQDRDLEKLLTSSVLISQGDHQLNAKLLQVGHSIDPITRTALINVEVNNPDHLLHAGMFVNVKFVSASNALQVLIPRTALSQTLDGDWQVFVRQGPNHFVAKEITITNDYGDEMEVSGLEVGEQLVTQGAFFLNAQAAKTSFDIHNH